MTTELDKAIERCRSQIFHLLNGALATRTPNLDDAASAVVQVNALQSDIGLIYDILYESANSQGLINRRMKNPLPAGEGI